MCRTSCVLELIAKGGERCRILVIAVYIAQQADQLLESGGIQTAVLLQTVFCAGTKLIKVPSRLGDADDRNVKISSFYHRLQGWEYLLVCKVAGGAEENERVRVGVLHECCLLHTASDFSAGFSKWPPNSKRIADSSLSA